VQNQYNPRRKYPRQVLLAEDLMLVLVRKSSGEGPKVQGTVGALAAALLIELAARGRLEVAPDDTLAVFGGPPFGDDLLDKALHLTAGTTEESITRIAAGLHTRVLDRLAGYQFLRKVRRPVTFGLLSKAVWRVAHPAHAEALRREITYVLLGETSPNDRTGPLIALLWALVAVDTVAEALPASAWTRAGEIAAGDWPAGPEPLAVTDLCLRAAREWHKVNPH
jgi:hypothetical protein